MKLTLLTILLAVVFTSCDIFNSQDYQNQIQALQVERDNLQGELDNIETELAQCALNYEVCNHGFAASIRDRDTLQLERAQLQSDILNFRSQINHLNDSHLAELAELKQIYNDSIAVLNDEANTLLNHALGLDQQILEFINALDLSDSLFIRLETLYNRTLNDNYLVTRSTAHQVLNGIQSKIEESELAYKNLLTIEEITPVVLDAIEATKLGLYKNYGYRKAIGDLFPIQVQSGIISD